MTPGTYNITIYQGATFSRLITWKDSGEAQLTFPRTRHG